MRHATLFSPPTSPEDRILTRSRAALAAKGAFQAFFGGLWSSGFSLAGRWPHARKATRWSAVGGQRVLVVAPHPDDEVVACGGTLLLHRAVGDRTCVVYATDGRQSTALGLSPEQMARTRRREAGLASKALGLDRDVWIGLRERDWRPEELSTALVAILLEERPHVVYTPSIVDFHPEHRAVARAVAAALSEIPAAQGSSIEVRVYEVQVPLTALLTNLVVDTSMEASTSLKAMEVYASQWGSIQACLRNKRYVASFHGAGSQAEAFCSTAAPQFVHWLLVEGDDEHFRGFRPLAWSDPLAYMTGRRPRRRAAALLRSEDA